MKHRPRDSQRKKVYRAGWAVSEEISSQFDNIHDLRDFVDKIFRSKWRKALWRKHSLDERLHVQVMDGRGRRDACMKNGWKRQYQIIFPRTSRSQLTILHEIAHVLIEEIFTIGRGQKVAYHGREFCAILLKLVRRWIGPDAARILKASFKKQKVKYTMSPLPKLFRCPHCGRTINI